MVIPIRNYAVAFGERARPGRSGPRPRGPHEALDFCAARFARARRCSARGRADLFSACFRTRPVRAPGLQKTRAVTEFCRPRALTRRFAGVFKPALSPNGAMTFQPRAERSAALGSLAKRKPALKGRSIRGAGRGIGSPLQGFGASPTPTQGDALGWNSFAPLGLNTSGHAEWQPGRLRFPRFERDLEREFP